MEGLRFPEYKNNKLRRWKFSSAEFSFRLCKPGHKHWTDRSLIAFTGLLTALQFA